MGKSERFGQKPLGTKWIFKVKVEQDGSKQYKSRCVMLGYLQIPGVVFTKTFLPVANNSRDSNCYWSLSQQGETKIWGCGND
jgi:hypothetical protein